MGKVKKLRQKYHMTLKKSKSLGSLPENLESSYDEKRKSDLFKSNENIFAGLDISFDELTKSLPKDFDVRSIVSTKSRREIKEEEKHLKKKEKQKRRHDRFLNKLEFTYQALKNSKANKAKQKKGYNSMNSLLDALPKLEPIPVESQRRKLEKVKAKPKGILKAKHRLKQQTSDSKIFKKILDNKQFKANPFDTITQYLRQRVSNDA
ncbi:hypothetical protein RUM43_002977 [Polyplax serrata]|uniref:Ribosome biogenesis protein SLX9 n=1 Tax=Polyplax serrata TaxID=468196 RepID=A0AAN8NVR2_POLSC